MLRRYLLGQARDAAKADDLVQETFLQMHRARHTFNPAFPLTPWAMAIARHVWLMHRRAASRRPWETDDVDRSRPAGAGRGGVAAPTAPTCGARSARSPAPGATP